MKITKFASVLWQDQVDLGTTESPQVEMSLVQVMLQLPQPLPRQLHPEDPERHLESTLQILGLHPL